MEPTPIIQALFIGQPKTITDEQGTWTSSIYRDPVNEPVKLDKGGFAGDKAAQPYHGGPDADICGHLLDHYRFWNTHYALALAPGFVGENITLDHIDEAEICAGDIVRLGTALAQVSGPRTPCVNLARRIGRPDWVKLTIQENRTGFYMRVLESGLVQAGDHWDLQERLNPEGSISAINRCMYLTFNSEEAQRITQMQGLGDWWKRQIRERLAQQDAHWTVTMTQEA